MNKEQIIRSEARDFIEDNLEYQNSSFGHRGHKETILKLRNELSNFHQSEAKMIFLDEVKKGAVENLEVHNKNCPKGENCETYQTYQKIIYFIDQEVDELPRIVNKNVVQSNLSRNTVFISYSHHDIKWLEDLKRHFAPFKDKIDFWDDSKIKPGQKWKEEIRVAIEKTKVAVLFISADFFNSRFVVENELPPLLKAADKDGATILSVILKPCLFDEYPEINQYQAINSPSNTVIQMDEGNRELTWVELVKQISSILK